MVFLDFPEIDNEYILPLIDTANLNEIYVPFLC